MDMSLRDLDILVEQAGLELAKVAKRYKDAQTRSRLRGKGR